MVVSAGILMFRLTERRVLEVLIAHMGGPFWERKTDHSWSIPKGLSEVGESDLIKIAEREFAEEMGTPPSPGPSRDLGSIRSGDKQICVFAREGTFDLNQFRSNEFEMEWPKGSGVLRTFPEVDRANWVTISEARKLLVKGQLPFLDRLLEELARDAVEFTTETPEDPTLF